MEKKYHRLWVISENRPELPQLLQPRFAYEYLWISWPILILPTFDRDLDWNEREGAHEQSLILLEVRHAVSPINGEKTKWNNKRVFRDEWVSINVLENEIMK